MCDVGSVASFFLFSVRSWQVLTPATRASSQHQHTRLRFLSIKTAALRRDGILFLSNTACFNTRQAVHVHTYLGGGHVYCTVHVCRIGVNIQGAVTCTVTSTCVPRSIKNWLEEGGREGKGPVPDGGVYSSVACLRIDYAPLSRRSNRRRGA